MFKFKLTIEPPKWKWWQTTITLVLIIMVVMGYHAEVLSWLKALFF